MASCSSNAPPWRRGGATEHITGSACETRGGVTEHVTGSVWGKPGAATEDTVQKRVRLEEPARQGTVYDPEIILQPTAVRDEQSTHSGAHHPRRPDVQSRMKVFIPKLDDWDE